MRQDQGCPGECSERRLELVRGGDYDQLTQAAAAGRARIRGLRPVVAELARAEPEPGGWEAAYQALQQSARAALRRFEPAPAGPEDPLSAADTVIVWRCQNCGGLDAPQECIDVCIWRPIAWVDAASYESARSAAAADRDLERSLAGLLGRLAFATPRPGHWEQGLRALRRQAQRVLEQETPDAPEALLPGSDHFPELSHPDVNVKYMFDMQEPRSIPGDTVQLPHDPDPAPVPLERLEAQICELAGHLAAATCRFLVLLADFDARRGWASWEMRSCAAWLSWKCQMSSGAAREHVRVARALHDLPVIRGEFAAGRLSYAKVRALTRIATPQNEAGLAEIAGPMTGNQLERFARAHRHASAAGDADAQIRRRLTWRLEQDGSLAGTFRLPPLQGAVLLTALRAAAGDLEHPHEDQAPGVSAETPAAVTSSSLADALLVLAEAFLAGQVAAAAPARPHHQRN